MWDHFFILYLGAMELPIPLPCQNGHFATTVAAFLQVCIFCFNTIEYRSNMVLMACHYNVYYIERDCYIFRHGIVCTKWH